MRRWIRAGLALTTAAALLSVGMPLRASTGLPGARLYREDINGDGKVNAIDVLAVLLMSVRGQTGPEGDIDGDGSIGLGDALQLLRNIRSGNLHALAVETAKWRVLGPGGGGSMYIPTVDPFDPQHAFVRCDMTGAYMTRDGGGSWRMFNLRTGVDDFEFDPGQPGTLYASNSGLYRSEDGGDTWRLIYPDPSRVLSERMVNDHADQSFVTLDGKPDRPIQRVLVDPADSRRIFLALPSPYIISLANPPVRSGSDVLIAVSEDRGASWQELGKVKGKEVRALFPGSWWGRNREVTVVTESSLARVSAADRSVEYLNPPPDTPILAAEGGRSAAGAWLYLLTAVRSSRGSVLGGIFGSSDGGTSWQALNADLLKGYTSTGKAPDFSTFGVSRNHPETLYLACAYYADATGAGDFGIWKTTDSGKTWNWVLRMNDRQVLTNNFEQSWIEHNYDQTWPGIPFDLGVGPADPDVCYASDMARTFRTADGGGTWEQSYSRDNADGSNSSRGLDVTSCYGVHFDPFDSLHTFVSMTDIGLFHTLNGAESWLQSNRGILEDWINTCYWVEFDPAVKGLAWSAWSYCHDLPRTKMLRSGLINQVQYPGGVALTIDGGLNWTVNAKGLPANAVCTHIILDPASPAGRRVLYVCAFGLGVYKSSDNGANWAAASNGISGNRNAWRLLRLPDGTLYLLVARGLVNGQPVDGALYRSTDAAGAWTRVPLPSGVLFPNDMLCDTSDPSRMYLSCWPWNDASVNPSRERGGGLFLTEDGGATWRQLFHDDAHVYAAALDPENPAAIVIGTFDSGAFRSDDRGASWRRLEGFTFKWGHRPVFDPYHPGMLYLTTFGGGVHYGPASGTSAADESLLDFPNSWRWSDIP